jgi:hypothetical protein
MRTPNLPAVHDLSETEAQAVINQLALAMAEHLGFAPFPRPLIARQPFDETDRERLQRATALAHAIDDVYGHEKYQRHVVTLLFGAPIKVFDKLAHCRELTPRQKGLIWALERFAASQGITASSQSNASEPERLRLNNIEAAEIAVNRIELGTAQDEGWRVLHFTDIDSYQRLEVANTLGPILSKDSIMEYAEQFYAKAGAPTTRGSDT